MATADEAGELENWTIHQDRIFKLNLIDDSTHDNVQILNFCKNAKNLLQNLKVENFPKVFVILIDFDEKIDEILKLIALKFTNRPLLVQVKSENSLNFYIKRENEFKRVESASNHENVKFTAEILLGNLKNSIIEANFSQLTAHDGGFIKHCHALDSDDDFCFRLLNLYEDNFNRRTQSKILLLVIKSDNLKFSLAYFNVFEPYQILKSESVDLKVNFYFCTKLEGILKLLIQIGDVENFIIVIKFLSNLNLFNDKDSNIFSQLMSFVVKNKFYKYYNVLEKVKIGYEEGQELDVLQFAATFGLTDLFIDTFKSLNSELNLSFHRFRYALIKVLKFLGKSENLAFFENVNVKLKLQEVLIEVLSNKSVAKTLINNRKLVLDVVSYGFEINLKFLFAKLFELYTPSEGKQILSKDKLLIFLTKHNSNINSVKFVWETMEKNFTENELYRSFTDFNWNYACTILLCNVAEHAKSQEIFEFIWLKIKSLVKDEEKLRKVLLLQLDSSHAQVDRSHALIKSALNEKYFKFILENVYFELFEPKKFILHETNFYQILAQHSSASVVEFATNLLKKRLSSDEFKAFIAFKGPNCKNILHFAVLNVKSEDFLKFLVNLIESEFGIEELRKMLNESDVEGFLPFHSALRYKDRHLIKNVILIYEEKFTFDELKEIFGLKKIIFIHFTLKKLKFFYSESLKNVLRTYFDPMASYYLKLTKLMANGDKIINLNNFFEKIKKKNDILEFLFFKIKILNYFVEFTKSEPKFEYFCYKITELFQDKEKLKEILLAKGSRESNALNFSFIKENSSSFDNKEKRDFFPFLFDKIYCVHLELEDFIYEKDSGGNNFTQLLAMHDSETRKQSVLNQIKVKLSSEKFKEFLRLKNYKQQNLLHFMALSYPHHSTSIEMKEKLVFIQNLVKKELSQHEVREMLLEKDDDENLPFDKFYKKVFGNFSTIFSFYVENFSENEIDVIIKRRIFDSRIIYWFKEDENNLRKKLC